MSRNGSSSDDDTPFSTQDLGDIHVFAIIRDKFGHLSKQEFLCNIVVDHTGVECIVKHCMIIA